MRTRKPSRLLHQLNTYRNPLAIVHESRLTAKRDRTLRFNHAGRRFTIRRVASHRSGNELAGLRVSAGPRATANATETRLLDAFRQCPSGIVTKLPSEGTY